ncbi:hypothetical protein [Acetobacter conturbans]|uniref:Transposase n=1 Tax=Acetobacter conturbans TaxID=1737472 RepID=A0ABX0K0S2_9PROT|nr:hypothetical protein [Acetobacter conturbans]NHN89186.1 hypothetical protein [Acetobacter conturbans]
MMSTDLITVLSRPAERTTPSRVRGRNTRTVSSAMDSEEDEAGFSSSPLSPDLSLDGPMPIFRRRGYYLDLLI